MIGNYTGDYVYNLSSISANAPDKNGVYYCLNDQRNPLYVGKSNSIENRLTKHYSEDKWNDVSKFGYVLCSTEQEALSHEASEIAKYRPKYNTAGK